MSETEEAVSPGISRSMSSAAMAALAFGGMAVPYSVNFGLPRNQELCGKHRKPVYAPRELNPDNRAARRRRAKEKAKQPGGINVY